jgi:hypothetical protein
VRQKAINHLGEFFGIGGIKPSRHAGGANFLLSAAAGLVWNRKNQSEEGKKNHKFGMGISHGIT